MARRRKKGGRRKRKISLFAAGGAVAAIKFLWDGWKSDGASGVFRELTGYGLASGVYDWKAARAGISLFGGAAASMVAAKTGINRYMNIPWFKL